MYYKTHKRIYIKHNLISSLQSLHHAPSYEKLVYNKKIKHIIILKEIMERNKVKER